MSGNLGGGREGVMRANYQNKSDMNRALLQSGMLQQGFTQANQLANQAFGQQQSLAQQVPGLYGQDIGTLRSAGAGQQGQTQAGLDALREQNRLAAYEPYERLGFQQTGVASIASGAPGQYMSQVQPNPTPLQNALGIASVGGGLLGNYGDYLRGGKLIMNNNNLYKRPMFRKGGSAEGGITSGLQRPGYNVGNRVKEVMGEMQSVMPQRNTGKT